MFYTYSLEGVADENPSRAVSNDGRVGELALSIVHDTLESVSVLVAEMIS